MHLFMPYLWVRNQMYWLPPRSAAIPHGDLAWVEPLPWEKRFACRLPSCPSVYAFCFVVSAELPPLPFYYGETSRLRRRIRRYRNPDERTTDERRLVHDVLLAVDPSRIVLAWTPTESKVHQAIEKNLLGSLDHQHLVNDKGRPPGAPNPQQAAKDWITFGRQIGSLPSLG